MTKQEAIIEIMDATDCAEYAEVKVVRNGSVVRVYGTDEHTVEEIVGAIAWVYGEIVSVDRDGKCCDPCALVEVM